MKNASRENNSNLTNTSNSTNTVSQSFSFDGTQDVQVVMRNGEPWFVAADVCFILGLSNPTDRIKTSLDNDEYLPYQINRLGQIRTVNIISESGLYALVVRSTKPNAKKFLKWVTSEVLPSIRKTGMYVTETKAEELTGRSYYVKVDSKYDNLYIGYVMEAFREFFEEELQGLGFTERRLNEKIKASQVLFPEYRKVLRNQNVKNRMK